MNMDPFDMVMDLAYVYEYATSVLMDLDVLITCAFLLCICRCGRCI